MCQESVTDVDGISTCISHVEAHTVSREWNHGCHGDVFESNVGAFVLLTGGELVDLEGVVEVAKGNGVARYRVCGSADDAKAVCIDQAELVRSIVFADHTFDLYDITGQHLGEGRRYLKRAVGSGINPHDFNPSPRRALTAYGSILDKNEGTQAAGNRAGSYFSRPSWSHHDPTGANGLAEVGTSIITSSQIRGTHVVDVGDAYVWNGLCSRTQSKYGHRQKE